MTEIALLLRLLVAAVLGIAAAAKLSDRRAAAAGLRGFGVPAGAAAPAAAALAGAELVVAAGLVAGPAGPALAAAVALAALFTGAQLVTLARGRRPDCNCFGARGATPIGARTVARSAGLGALAAAALVAGPGPGAHTWVADLAPAGQVAVGAAVAFAALAAVVGFVLLQILRAQGRILLRLEALEAAGAPPAPEAAPAARRVPGFDLASLTGERVSLAGLLAAGRPVVLAFTDTRCTACRSLLPRLAAWQRDPAITLAIVAAGDPAEVRAEAAEHDLGLVLLEADGVADLLGVAGTPSALVIDPGGRPAGAVGEGVVGVTALVTRAVEMGSVPGLGDAAPVAALSGPDGEPVALARDGRPRVVVFWDPTCPACVHALEDLRAWDRQLGPDRLVVISRGRADRTRELALASPVALDADDELTRAFGVRGTPSAVLVDAGGAIATPVAEGAPAIDVLVGMARRAELTAGTAS